MERPSGRGRGIAARCKAAAGYWLIVISYWGMRNVEAAFSRFFLLSYAARKPRLLFPNNK
jgi:hypothetical protein